MTEPNRSHARYALWVLFGINMTNFFDRQILAAVAEPIRKEWLLNDTQLGVLNTVFTLIYAVAGVPLGRLADRGARKKVLAVGVTVWSVMTAASGLAWNYATLFAARAKGDRGRRRRSSRRHAGNWMPARRPPLPVRR